MKSKFLTFAHCTLIVAVILLITLFTQFNWHQLIVGVIMLIISFISYGQYNLCNAERQDSVQSDIDGQLINLASNNVSKLFEEIIISIKAVAAEKYPCSFNNIDISIDVNDNDPSQLVITANNLYTLIVISGLESPPTEQFINKTGYWVGKIAVYELNKFKSTTSNQTMFVSNVKIIKTTNDNL